MTLLVGNGKKRVQVCDAIMLALQILSAKTVCLLVGNEPWNNQLFLGGFEYDHF